MADVTLEFLTWSVTVAAALAEASPPPAPAPAALRDAPPRGRRDVFDPALGKTELLPAYDRTDLAPGARLAGPALVTEPQTTTLLPAGPNLEVTAAGHLLLERR